MRTKIGFADIAVCSAAFLLALAILMLQLGARSSDDMSVRIKTDSDEAVYSIRENREIKLTSAGHSITVEIKDGAVRVKESDCPDKLCVSSGWIKNSSRPVVCAPAKVLVSIIHSGGVEDADFIAG